MIYQETKTKFIEQGRKQGAYGLILYEDSWNACVCHFVQERGSMSTDYKELEQEGYAIIEEIFL